jgi:hypothetical protein
VASFRPLAWSVAGLGSALFRIDMKSLEAVFRKFYLKEIAFLSFVF